MDRSPDFKHRPGNLATFNRTSIKWISNEKFNFLRILVFLTYITPRKQNILYICSPK